MNKKIVMTALLGSCLLIESGCQGGMTQKKWETTEMPRVSVHDPSIFQTKDAGTYYIFGSHLAQAKSHDLRQWQVPFQREYEEPENNIILGDLKENLKESFQWAGYDDADSAGGFSIWAPDVIWNEAYQWGNGDQGAYMYFYSASSTWRRSCIGFAVAKTIEGPYEYRDTIVYSGFTKESATDGSERDIQYTHTNLKELIAEGEISGFSERWGKSATEYNSDEAPNAIDPTLFFDKKGKLWMTYGSWSGGVFLLELDPATGSPKYPGKDSQTSDGRVIDRYFGIKLSGGKHQSGEGPYIRYDPKTDYYYYFVTYGGLTANGGYNMRLFRAKDPTGPYVDMLGETGIITPGRINDDFGLKVMGNYQLSGQAKAYKAQGHNSFLINEKGQRLLVFHTRFSGGEAHEVRIHPLEVAPNDWLVALPLEYQPGYQKVSLADQDLVGSYEFVDHGTTSSSKVTKTLNIQLHQDGSITGDKSGAWFQKDQGLMIAISGIDFQGIATKQIDTSDGQEKIVFAAVGENRTIWGIKKAGL